MMVHWHLNYLKRPKLKMVGMAVLTQLISVRILSQRSLLLPLGQKIDFSPLQLVSYLYTTVHLTHRFRMLCCCILLLSHAPQLLPNPGCHTSVECYHAPRAKLKIQSASHVSVLMSPLPLFI